MRFVLADCPLLKRPWTMSFEHLLNILQDPLNDMWYRLETIRIFPRIDLRILIEKIFILLGPRSWKSEVVAAGDHLPWLNGSNFGQQTKNYKHRCFFLNEGPFLHLCLGWHSLLKSQNRLTALLSCIAHSYDNSLHLVIPPFFPD